MPAKDTQLWTTDEAAHYLRLHPVTLRGWRSDQRPDQPPFIRLGTAVRYSPGELARWAAGRTITSSTRPTARKNHGPDRQRRRPGPQ